MFLTYCKYQVSFPNYFVIVLLRLIKITIFFVQETFPFVPFVIDEHQLVPVHKVSPPTPFLKGIMVLLNIVSQVVPAHKAWVTLCVLYVYYPYSVSEVTMF